MKLIFCLVLMSCMALALGMPPKGSINGDVLETMPDVSEKCASHDCLKFNKCFTNKFSQIYCTVFIDWKCIHENYMKNAINLQDLPLGNLNHLDKKSLDSIGGGHLIKRVILYKRVS